MNRRQQVFLEKLTQSQIYRDYQTAFEESTGLPLAVTSPQSWGLPHRFGNSENPFCALMAKNSKSCAACLEVQERLSQNTSNGNGPVTVRCFAGMCDSAVPIRMGDELLGLLQTGQTLTESPSEADFDRITRDVMKWGIDVDLKDLREAYFNTRVLGQKQYEALVRMLEVFSRHLALVGSQLEIIEENRESPIVKRVRAILEDCEGEDISSRDMARMLNTSTFYFCKMFKKATGLTFTEYLTRIRVEKAKNYLLNPHLRISEIAYTVGFNSLSQFNRSFKNLVGQSPSQYRAEQAVTEELAEAVGE